MGTEPGNESRVDLSKSKQRPIIPVESVLLRFNSILSRFLSGL